MSASLSTNASSAERRTGHKTNRYAAIATLGFVLLSMAIAFFHRPSSTLLRAVFSEWHLWLLLLSGLTMAVIVQRWGIPATTRGKATFAALNASILAVAGMLMFDTFEYVTIRILQVALRVAVLGCWGFAMVGAPLVAWWIWRRAAGIRKPLPWAKWWFACVVLIVAAEPVAAYVKFRRERLDIPVLTKAPPENEFHAVALGESTMLGWPYVAQGANAYDFRSRFGIPAVYEWQLRRMYPDKKIIVHNLAKQGVNLRLAIQELERLPFRPHHILLCSGHNEFHHDLEEMGSASKTLFYQLDRRLDYSPTFHLLNKQLAARSAVRDMVAGGGRTFVDHPMAEPLAYSHRVERFRHQLEQLARYCRDNGVTTQWIVPASSESTYEPDRSFVSGGATKDEEQMLIDRYHEALALEAAEKWDQAAGIYREQLGNHPGFAEFHFRLAECLMHLEQYDEARWHFQAARDNDGKPSRATSDFCRQIAKVAESFAIPHFDAAEVLRPHTKFGILDRTMIHDNCHPTLPAFFLLGMAAADQARRSGELESRLGEASPVEPAELSTVLRELGINVDDLVAAYRHTANDLRWLGRLRFDDSRRMREAQLYDEMADQLAAGTIKPGENGTEPLE